MVPAIRNILGGFLFSGDDIYKRVAVLSGGERTRLAVARMLLRPSNTLLLDEPTNHLDLDSKDVLLEALEDYGGTLIFVSHDRYFVEKLATKIIEIGHGEAVVYPGTYAEFLWHKARGSTERGRGAATEGRESAGANARSQKPAPQSATKRRHPGTKQDRDLIPETTPLRPNPLTSREARKRSTPRGARSSGHSMPCASGLPTWSRASPSARRRSRKSRRP